MNRPKPKPIIYKGHPWTITDLAKQVGLPRELLRERLKKGMSIEEAINYKYKPKSTNPEILYNPMLGQILSKPWRHYDA